MCLNVPTFDSISNWGKQHFLEGDWGAWRAVICCNLPWSALCQFSLGLRLGAECGQVVVLSRIGMVQWSGRVILQIPIILSVHLTFLGTFKWECCLVWLVQIDHLYHTASMLWIAARIAGFQRQVNCRFVVDITWYVEVDFLWGTLNAHQAIIGFKDQQRDSKAMIAPNLYQCAAEGCGTKVMSKSGLSQRSGPCSVAIKPSYCLKECQHVVCWSDLHECCVHSLQSLTQMDKGSCLQERGVCRGSDMR